MDTMIVNNFNIEFSAIGFGRGLADSWIWLKRPSGLEDGSV
jgi:hypothetical protein